MNSDKKVCLITGATNGVGRAAASAIAAQGFQMILVGRDEQRGHDTVEEVKRNSSNDAVTFLKADLASVVEVQSLTERVKQSYDRLDVLANNAGAIFQSRKTNPQGFEMTFALNHLAYFVLTVELLDLLKKSAPSRIINVSSGAHRFAKLRFDDLHFEKSYSPFKAYSRSKLANILFTNQLARILDGTGVTANSMHPGFVASGFAMNNGPFAQRTMKVLSGLFGRTPEKGAQTLVYLATSPEVEGINGSYFIDKKPRGTSGEAKRPDTAQRLWEVSLELSKLHEPG